MVGDSRTTGSSSVLIVFAGREGRVEEQSTNGGFDGTGVTERK